MHFNNLSLGHNIYGPTDGDIELRTSWLIMKPVIVSEYAFSATIQYEHAHTCNFAYGFTWREWDEAAGR